MVEKRGLEEAQAEVEVIRLNRAIRQVIDELVEDNFQLSQRIDKKEAEIFLTHLAILEDPYFIAQILKEEGYIQVYEVVDGSTSAQKVLRIRLKYVGERRDRRSVITGLERISRPGRRVYTGKRDIPWVLSGMGIAILSTPKGVMTGQKARQMGVGGEVICKIW